mgnify:CR=1 FL=1
MLACEIAEREYSEEEWVREAEVAEEVRIYDLKCDSRKNKWREDAARKEEEAETKDKKEKQEKVNGEPRPPAKGMVLQAQYPHRRQKKQRRKGN